MPEQESYSHVQLRPRALWPTSRRSTGRFAEKKYLAKSFPQGAVSYFADSDIFRTFANRKIATYPIKAKNNDRATTNKKTSVNRRKNNDSSPLLPVEIHTLEVQNLHLNQYDIEKLIYVIRGRQVMIDSDLAMLYGEETKYLKRAVRANIS